MNTSAKLSLSLLTSCALASASGAVTLFSDNFSDTNTTGWFSSSGTGGLDASSGAMAVSSGRHAQSSFSATTLAVGDTITFTFDVSFAGVSSQSNGFRFGLFDSNGAALPSANGNSGFVAYDGIVATTNPAAASGTPVAFRARTPNVDSGTTGYDTLISTLGIYTTVGSAGGSAVTFPNATFLDVTLTYTRTASGLDLAYTAYNGATLLQSHSVSTTSPSTYTFDVLAISGVSGLGNFTLDNVNVDFIPAAVPEPSTAAALAGLGILGFAAMRRRRA